MGTPQLIHFCRFDCHGPQVKRPEKLKLYFFFKYRRGTLMLELFFFYKSATVLNKVFKLLHLQIMLMMPHAEFLRDNLH